MGYILNRHVFSFNDHDNGGEQLVLTTEFFDNGDDITDESNGIYVNQELTLESYSNSASFNLTTAGLTSDLLRKLANELDMAESKALNNKMLKVKV